MKGVYSIYTPGGVQEIQILYEGAFMFTLLADDNPAALLFRENRREKEQIRSEYIRDFSIIYGKASHALDRGLDIFPRNGIIR
jgi:hypothetical protein